MLILALLLVSCAPDPRDSLSSQQKESSNGTGVEQSPISTEPPQIEDHASVEHLPAVLSKESRDLVIQSQKRIAAMPIPEPGASKREIRDIRRELAHELLARLETLIEAPGQRGIRNRLQDIADRMSLLAKAETIPIPLEQQTALIPESESERIEELSRLWRERENFSTTADDVFQDYGLMSCEHVPEMLRIWVSPAS